MAQPTKKRTSSDSSSASVAAPSWFDALTAPSSTTAYALTLAFASTPSQLLYPFFSSAPTDAIGAPFHLLMAFVGVVTYALLPLPRLLRWEVHWIALGLVLIASDAVARQLGERFMGLGLDGGVWVARLAVEGPPTVLRWWCVLKGVSATDQVSGPLCSSGTERELTAVIQRGSVRILSVLALPVYLASGWQPAFLPLIPECYIVNCLTLIQ